MIVIIILLIIIYYCYDIQCIIYIGLMIGILVKAPVWPVHSWLPIAHSESPIGGSNTT